MKYLIVGGVAGGATTAARLRRLDEEAEIIMFERGGHISYANCGLPYYIGDVIKDRENLLLQTPESFRARFNVDVRVNSEVRSIDAEKKTVEVKRIGSGATYTENYDKLVLSPGAKPILPKIPGVESDRVFTLRNVPDTDRIKKFIEEKQPNSAIVVGAGFIGLEMAENLHALGMNVSVVEMAPQIMAMLDLEMVSFVHNHFKEKEVGLFLDEMVVEIQKQDDSIGVALNSGTVLDTDMVIMSIGVMPDTEFISSSGVELNNRKAIIVDEYFETSQKDIYAVGDAITFEHPITKNQAMAYLAGPANHQARTLADNLVWGNKRKYKGAIGTAIAKVFDWTVASTGASEKVLAKTDIDYASTIINANDHAGYYPGALQMAIKITFDKKTGKLYGGQAVGYQGVDKRIDLIATIIKNGGDIWDLQEIEQAYAPPFSSAKDPVNQIGYNAENIIKGLFKPMSVTEVDSLDKKEFTILDVRTKEEVALGMLEGAIHIPVDELRQNLDKIPTGTKKILVYCGVGLRGYVASRVLNQKGYDAYNLSGGLKVYNYYKAEQSNTIVKNKKTPGKLVRHSREESHIVEKRVVEVDARGLQCPGPIMRLKEEVEKLKPGERLVQMASDPGFFKDVESWCNVTGNLLVSRSSEKGTITATVEKANPLAKNTVADTDLPASSADVKDGQTIVVFSDDMDRALASFVIANGAAAMGKKVTLFFTFWGLNVIKSEKKTRVSKDFMGKMFGMMMSPNAKKLNLSKMNMCGLGAKMMRGRMKSKNIDLLEEMIVKAKNSGVEMIACQMSMDMMGVDKAEFVDGIEIGGVANYLEKAGQSGNNLFI